MIISMQADEIYKHLSEFLKNEPSCVKALSCLNSKAQIGIEIAGQQNVCVQYLDNEVVVNEGECFFPDFIFKATPPAIEIMISERGLSTSQLGVKLLKNMLTQQIQIAMPGHLIQILRRGYPKILAVGGPQFLSELKKYDLGSIKKIISFLKTLKK